VGQLPFGSTPIGMLDVVDSLPSLELARQETVNLSENTPRRYATDEVNYTVLRTRKTERLRHEKINPDPYTKRTAGRVAATPALQNKPGGLASCTTQAHARCRLEYPRLAVAGAYGTRARTPFAASPWSDTSRTALEYFTEANCHVSSNPHVHGTPATDSRRSADPTP